MDKVARGITICLGAGLITLGFFGNSMGFGVIGFGVFDFIAIVIGVVLLAIGIFWAKAAQVVGTNIIVFFVLVEVLDVVLYFNVQNLPMNLVTRMSRQAQTRYTNFHKGQERYIKQRGGESDTWCHPDYYGRPNFAGYDFTYTWRYDEFGYRNPPGYISENKPMDVVLVGDSFTEGWESGLTVGDFLRDYLKPDRVYSLGVAFSCPANWSCQFRRYATSPYFKNPPKLIIANLYSGNDLELIVENSFKWPFVQEAEAADVSDDAKGVFMDPQIQHNRSRIPFRNEFLMVLEKYAEEELINTAFVPDHNRVLSGMLGLIGIKNGEKWSPKFNNLLRFRERPTEKVQWDMLDKQLAMMQKKVLELSPSSKVVVSFIPTPAGVCDVTAREKGFGTICDDDTRYQEGNSLRIKEMSEKFGFYYVDVSPSLREYAAHSENSVYMPGGHFNPEGYKLYSKFLAEQVRSLL